MLVTASYTAQAVRSAVLQQTGYSGFEGRVAEESTDLTLLWWKETGYTAASGLDAYAVETCPNSRQLYSLAFQYVRERVQTQPQFGFIVPAFILIAMISAVVQWVVHLILDYLFRDRTAAAAFAQG